MTYRTAGKRAADLAGSLLGLALCAPLLALIAAAVKADSPGPVLFRQERMGRGGKTFTLLKFRTMYRDPERERAQFEPGRRGRVTRAGRVLRRTKLDELPQLVNVLRGDMSLVGPRPEVPKYREFYRGPYARLLDLRPGITDPASIKYRHEEELLAASPDPERLYRETILPDKLEENLRYADGRGGFLRDLAVIVRTLRHIAP